VPPPPPQCPHTLQRHKAQTQQSTYSYWIQLRTGSPTLGSDGVIIIVIIIVFILSTNSKILPLMFVICDSIKNLCVVLRD
jgi:hypothetical protein